MRPVSAVLFSDCLVTSISVAPQNYQYGHSEALIRVFYIFFGFSKGLYTGASATDAQDTLFTAGISVCLPDLRHAFFAKQGQAFLTTHSNIEALSYVRIASVLWLYGRRIQEHSVFRLSIMIIVCCLTQPVSCTPSKEHSSENINIKVLFHARVASALHAAAR